MWSQQQLTIRLDARCRRMAVSTQLRYQRSAVHNFFAKRKEVTLKKLKR